VLAKEENAMKCLYTFMFINVAQDIAISNIAEYAYFAQPQVL